MLQGRKEGSRSSKKGEKMVGGRERRVEGRGPQCHSPQCTRSCDSRHGQVRSTLLGCATGVPVQCTHELKSKCTSCMSSDISTSTVACGRVCDVQHVAYNADNRVGQDWAGQEKDMAGRERHGQGRKGQGGWAVRREQNTEEYGSITACANGGRIRWLCMGPGLKELVANIWPF